MIAEPEARVPGLASVVARSPSAVAEYLERLHARHDALDDGEVATYIPELARADPALRHLHRDGRRSGLRGRRHARALHDPVDLQAADLRARARAAGRRRRCASRIGVEPSGDAFNEISLAPSTGMPLQPDDQRRGDRLRRRCVAGALERSVRAACSRRYSALRGAARSRSTRPSTARSATPGHRNRAIAHLLRNFDVIDGEPDAALDLYFRQCSVSVDCRDLAMIAATLANGGVNPLHGRARASREDVVRDVLSVMTTCGMYDSAGEWLVSVGPAGQERRLGRRSSPCCRAGSGSPSSRRGSTRAATACAASPSAATCRATSACTSCAPASARRRRVRAAYYARRPRVQARAQRRVSAPRCAPTACARRRRGAAGRARASAAGEAARALRRRRWPSMRPTSSSSTRRRGSAPMPAGRGSSPRSPSASRAARRTSRAGVGPARAGGRRRARRLSALAIVRRPRRWRSSGPRTCCWRSRRATRPPTTVPLAEHGLLRGADGQPSCERVGARARARSSRRAGTLLVRQGDAALGGLPRHPRRAQRAARRRRRAACASPRSRPAGRSASWRTWIAASAHRRRARGFRVACRTLRYAAIDALAGKRPGAPRQAAAQPARRRLRDAARRERGDRPSHALSRTTTRRTRCR